MTVSRRHLLNGGFQSHLLISSLPKVREQKIRGWRAYEGQKSPDRYLLTFLPNRVLLWWWSLKENERVCGRPENARSGEGRPLNVSYEGLKGGWEGRHLWFNTVLTMSRSAPRWHQFSGGREQASAPSPIILKRPPFCSPASAKNVSPRAVFRKSARKISL